MGTKEEIPGKVGATPTSTNVSADNKNSNITNDAHQEQQTQHVQLPKASPAPPVIIVPASQTTTAATNAAKKIRRAFSMPRNPFRWSRKFKTSNSTADNGSSAGGSNSAISSCVGGGRGRAGSIVSLSSYEAICKDTNGGAVSGARESNTSGSIKRDAIGKVGEQKIVNGKPVSCGNESNNNSGTTNTNRVLRRSSFRKFLNRIAQHVSTSINVGKESSAHKTTGIVPFYTACWRRKKANKNATVSISTTADRVPPIGNYQWPADQTPGVMGLKNHGNTCFMNAVLQCLSHTDILAEYFVLDQYKADLKRRNKINSRKFGTKGELTEQLANVLKALWTCKNESDHSTSFKAVVDRYGSQFRSSTQHDAQEFLFWLLDKVHEDLNTATKRRYKSNSYGRPDEVIAAETLANHIRCNNSFVQAVFQAQFRSSLTCPRCKKQSNTFDPFHCISVQLPQLMQQTIFVTVVYLKRDPRQVKIGISVPTGSPIVALREQLQADTGIQGKHMVLVDISKEGFTRVFYDSQPVATLSGIETIYCIEVPEAKIASLTGTTTPAKVDTEKCDTSRSSNPNSNQSTEKNAATTEVIKNNSTGSTANATTNGAKNTTNSSSTANTTNELLLLVANVHKRKTDIENKKTPNGDSSQTHSVERFGMPFSLLTTRDCSYVDLQKRLLREMTPLLKPEVFSSAKPISDMFQMRLQDPSADPDTYLHNVEHPLLTEMIDLALSVLSAEAGPPHIKLLLEWTEPDEYFVDLSDTVVEDESVARLVDVGKLKATNDTPVLTLEQCLEHYTKAETLSAEDAWRCPHCQQYLPVVKTLGLWSLPDILVVHFKRFRQHHEKGANAAKLTTMVKFPLNAFDMSPHLVRGVEEENGPRTSLSAAAAMDNGPLSRSNPWKKSRPGDSRSSTLSSRDNRETRYDLYAVCYHQGDTLETGHYTAACKNPYDRQWYKFDDQRVSKVPDTSIEEEIINNEAYMLFYQRRVGDAAECSGSSSNSGDHWVSRIAPPPNMTVVEKISAAEEKVIEEDISEDKKNIEEIATTAIIEPLPEKPEEKPIDIPKLKKAGNENEIVAEVKIETCPMVVNNENISVDIETLEFADSESVALDEDIPVIGTNEVSVLKTSSILTPNKTVETVNNSVGENQIFAMDEDCQIEESSSQATVEPSTNNTTTQIKSQKSPLTLPKTTTVADVKAEPVVSSIASNSPIEITTTKVLTNGYTKEDSKSPKQKLNITPPVVNGKPKSPATTVIATKPIAAAINGNRVRNSSTSSSSSSLSSHSSPHSLAVSIHGASTLQNKFNGFTTTSATASSNYKEVLLSSSLKSNSSSIISAAVAAHTAHEFHLTRHQPWNGSRSSVSALESGTQTNNHQHMHGLNLRHSFSTSSNCKLRECSETLSSMLRNSSNTCSKDTLIFIDQQNHHHHHHSLIEDDDDTFMGSRSLWISPVTPHKLITVSPKN
ncbi:ubiquitin carboxyl-terminal hydrolase 31 isoform X2 [Zeugodacus cucurbitae]|uniref:ubiquitin carboxyl-terminal hydrolase 31 isoform X2 n=1 Tax=Zeugodacus cucurbitae TaxID=28588 RepID=UPI0023D9418F|nr:ubiquitin carboxyl-terminal hydrolase 31 isoform X2 [Zeugodacus cucurbitae]